MDLISNRNVIRSHGDERLGVRGDGGCKWLPKQVFMGKDLTEVHQFPMVVHALPGDIRKCSGHLKMLAACSLLNHVELAKAFKDWPIHFSMVIA